MSLADGETILFTGDSITDCGRDWPLGEGPGLGSGYVSLVESTWAVRDPERRIRVLNTGISGNRVIDLETRWESDVLAHGPDWLSVMIGINDVWRQMDDPGDRDVVTIERYEDVYRRLLVRTRPGLRGLVLMTPYVIEPDRRERMREAMDRYSGVVRGLADEFEAVFVDVQGAFDRYLAHRAAATLAEDRVHPNLTGHMIIAQAFLAAMTG